MAITNSLGLGSGLIRNAQQGHTTIASNTSGAYQNPAMWDQDRAYRDEMIRREERTRLEQRYREEIQRYGYAVQEQAPVKKVNPVRTDSFPEGHVKNLLLLLEN